MRLSIKKGSLVFMIANRFSIATITTGIFLFPKISNIKYWKHYGFIFPHSKILLPSGFVLDIHHKILYLVEFVIVINNLTNRTRCPVLLKLKI